jgi:hypothetical protein
MLMWLLLAVSRVARWLTRSRTHGAFRPKPAIVLVSTGPTFRPSRNQRKPDWVRRAVIRLRAYSPQLGCRKIADAFNRQYAISHRESVSKSYVADVLRKHAWEIARLRRTIKHQVPRDLPRNRVWALDLTKVADLSGQQRLVLGIVDHGTRACLRLTEIADKRSQGGGICSAADAEPVAMGEFDLAAQRRTVFRSTPVRRAISCWLAPCASNVAIVTHRYFRARKVLPPLALFPCHRGDRFPRSRPEPVPQSRHLNAGCRPTSRQNFRRPCP